jgi:hypothetical protein
LRPGTSRPAWLSAAWIYCKARLLPAHPSLDADYPQLVGYGKYNDARVFTLPRPHISSADVIIADCTGRNPNVFYELGMAHILNKPVILITSDAVKQAPTDIRCFEFIRYELDDHRGFLEKLDNSL